MTTILLLSAGILACICLSAFFSSSEIAYSACNRVRLENARDSGDRRAALAIQICDRFDDALGAILIGNNLVNIAASSMASVLVILLLGESYTWVSTVAVTVIVIIFGETVPKIRSKKNANRTALSHAGFVHALMIILKPLIAFVVWLVNGITSLMKGESEDPDGQEAVEELQSIIETAEDEDVLDEDRSELVQAAIDFDEISASEAMTARVDMQALDIEHPDELFRFVLEEEKYSRIPVYEGSIDHIIGILTVNRCLKALTCNHRPDIRGMLMPPCYVYKTMKLPDVLEKMRRERQHLAIVTDEYGGTLGIISMEDVLEELVGEIWDETDEVEQEVVERAEGTYELDGDMTLDDFLELADIPEEEFDAESGTVGGWVMERFGGFPKSGDSFEAYGLRFTVLAMSPDGLRVEKLLAERLTPRKEK